MEAQETGLGWKGIKEKCKYGEGRWEAKELDHSYEHQKLRYSYLMMYQANDLSSKSLWNISPSLRSIQANRNCLEMCIWSLYLTVGYGTSMNSIKSITIHYENHLFSGLGHKDLSNWEPYATFYTKFNSWRPYTVFESFLFQCWVKNQGQKPWMLGKYWPIEPASLNYSDWDPNFQMQSQI